MVPHHEQVATAATENESQGELLLAPYFLVRVAGLPFTSIDQLQFPRTVAIIEEILQIEAWQNEHVEALQEGLRNQGKLMKEKECQHKCLDLRRAITSQNGQKAQRLLSFVAPCLSEDLVSTCQQWCQYSIRQAELLMKGETALEDELIENRKKLRHMFRQEAFQRGLLLSSETLYAELQHYLAIPAEKSNNRLRRAEEGLLSYFVRMATKTSPYSTFCSTSAGTWARQSKSPAHMQLQNWQQQSHIRFHTRLITTIAQLLATRPEIRPYLHPRLNSTLRWIPGNQPGDNASTNTDQQGKTAEKIEILVQEKVKDRLYGYQERLVRIRITPLTRAIISCIEQAQGALTYQEIIEQVVDGLLRVEEGVKLEGNNFTDYDQRAFVKQRVTAALEALTGHTVIALDLRIPAHEDDRLRFLIQQLSAIPGQWVAEIRDMLEQIYQLIDRYTRSSVSECAQILQTIRTSTLEVCREIGALQNPPWDPTETIDSIYPTLILEDTMLPFTELTLEQQSWEPVFQDLEALQKIAPLLDIATTMKIHVDYWAQNAFLQAPSSMVDLISNHLRFWQEFMLNPDLQQQWQRHNLLLRDLHERQQALTTLLAQQVQQAQQEGTRMVRLHAKDLHQFAQHLPAFLRQRSALAHFGHLFFDQGTPQMVLNETWTGPGTAFSRFSHLFQQYSREETTFIERLRAYITDLGRRKGVIYASIAETGNLNVNIHGQLTPYEILFPLSVSQHPKEEQLSLRDLYVMLDSQRQELQLFSQRFNARIAPLHLGFSLIGMMPPLYQALVTTTVHYPQFDLVKLLESQLSSEQQQQTRHYPRIALGHVILNRESWRIPSQQLPRQEAGETAFNYFLKLNRWRVAKGLPQRGFRRILSTTADPMAPTPHMADNQAIGIHAETQDTAIAPGASSHRISKALSKPFYIDFHNYFLLALLNTTSKALAENTTLVFEEVLPLPEHHLLKKESQSFATEFILEMS